ncbi:hypothetical protein HY745_00325 [Candidatus Desantisbacteria bacterium]|nr:hypothetical protein [Candidatus Desantisbacteria bacterium]
MKIKIKIIILILIISGIKIAGSDENITGIKKFSYYIYNDVEKKDLGTFYKSEVLKIKMAETLKKNFNMIENDNCKKADVVIICSVFESGKDYSVYYLVQVPFTRFSGLQSFKDKIDYSKVIDDFNLDLKKSISSIISCQLNPSK